MRPKNRKNPFGMKDEKQVSGKISNYDNSETIEDLTGLARLGGDILKRTVTGGFEALKEGIPKEASQLLAKGKEEMLKGLSKDVLNNLLSSGIDKFFTSIREHKLEVSVKIKKDSPTEVKPKNKR
jgi:hypothetical protein